MKDPRDIIKRPIITEHTSDLMANKRYVFEVDMKANKTEIKQAVEQIFKVKVVEGEHDAAAGQAEALRPLLRLHERMEESVRAAEPGQQGTRILRSVCLKSDLSKEGIRSADQNIQTDFAEPAPHVGLDVRGNHDGQAGEVAACAAAQESGPQQPRQDHGPPSWRRP